MTADKKKKPKGKDSRFSEIMMTTTNRGGVAKLCTKNVDAAIPL